MLPRMVRVPNAPKQKTCNGYRIKIPGCVHEFNTVKALAAAVKRAGGPGETGVRTRLFRNPDIGWDQLILPARSTGGASPKWAETRAKRTAEMHDVCATIDARKKELGVA